VQMVLALFVVFEDIIAVSGFHNSLPNHPAGYIFYGLFFLICYNISVIGF
jgi:hypothetical protein